MVQATLDGIINKYNGDKRDLIKVLRDIQRDYEWLSVEALQQVSKKLGLSPTKVYRAAIFGKGFRVIPRNRHPVATNICIVNLTKYYLDFLQYDLCGKCVACREGVRQMYNIVSDITEGNSEEGNVELLKEVATFVAKLSACIQGVIVANTILTALDDFRDQFEVHLNGNCPAGVCTSLLRSYELVGQGGRECL